MEFLAEHWLDALGWGGSALLVYSLLQASVVRLRILNLIACLVLLVFNALIDVWPMVAMNAVLCVINLWFIVQIFRTRDDDTTFEVLEVRPDDAYLAHVLQTNAKDIRRFQPDFTAPRAGDHTFLVQKGSETVGIVVMEVDEGVARVRLDHVTPRYRDFAPGKFVWRQSGLLREHGVTRVLTSPAMVGAYYGKVGFTRHGSAYELRL